MTLFDTQKFQTALDADGEFSIAGRFLTGALKLEFGDEALLLKFTDGRLTKLLKPALFDTADVTITGPVSHWQELLQPLPRPFFHDMFAAIVRGQFRWHGNSETFFAYYGAFRRLFQIMRDCAVR